jgi:CRP/FNR family transcriptional regulator, nitrogen oxide reductase regulator
MEHHPNLDILKCTELFRNVSDSALSEIRAAAFGKHIVADDVLFQQGDPARTFYILVSGRLRATQMTAQGQQVIIRYIGPGEFAGYTALYGGETHPGSVTALDASELLGWSTATIKEIMAQHPAIVMNAVEALGTRYHEMQVRLRQLSTENVQQRIAHTILQLAQQAGRRTMRGIEIAFPLSRQDVAELAGTTLHTVSRTLSGWETQGIVDSGRRRVIVCKPDMLKSISEGG